MVWTDLDVLVVDIDESIGGVIGMDLLTSGWLDAILSSGEDGYLEKVTFDFRGSGEDWAMLLDINPDLDVVLPEPASLALLALGAISLLRRRR